MKNILLYIILTWLTVCGAQAQPRCSFTHYSADDGLSQNTVMAILQDQKDNLWFATWDGINRFDGYTFKKYKAHQGNYINLTNNRADRMYEDRYGFLWLLTYDNRAYRFDPRRETFEQVPADGRAGSDDNVRAIQVTPNGTVWLLTDHNGAMRVRVDPEREHALTIDLYTAKSAAMPGTRVNNVYQDRQGNDWLLTDNGLGMLSAADRDPTYYFVGTRSVRGEAFQGFYAALEYDGDICFGSDHGRVWRYLRATDEFKLLELPTEARVSAMSALRDGRVVFATNEGSFFVYDPRTGQSTLYSHVTSSELPAKPILSTYVDSEGEVWLEQEEQGVVTHFNPATGTLKREQMRVEYATSERSRPAFHIHEDRNGYLWVHPYGGGFSYFDRKRNRLVPFYNDFSDPMGWRFSNKIHAAFSDKQGNLWLCTHSKGLEKATFRNVVFSLLTPVEHEYESIGNEVRAICEDSRNKIWMGLKDGTIRLYDIDRRYLGYLTEQGTVARSGQRMRGTAYFITQDSKGTLWIATKGDGLVKAEPSSPEGMSYKLTRYQHEADNMYSLSDNNVYCVYEDHRGRLWTATFGGGINYMTTDEQGRTIFINHRNHLKGYPANLCPKARFITSDNRGRIWVGTTTGAVAFSEDFARPEDLVFHHYARVPNDPRSLSNNDVHWITAVGDSTLYLATFGGGLDKLLSITPQGEARFKSYSEADGLSSTVLLSIRADRHNQLWISGESGVCKFNPDTERFEDYDERSIGFPVRFSEAASMLTSRGTVCFGTSRGLFMFNPDSIHKSSYVPPIVFSRLTVGNEEVTPAEGSILAVDLDDTDRLTLSHRENIFSLHYAALDYTNPQNIQYAYMLDGFEKQWMFADKQRSVTYTNLPKGNYVFRVRSTNSDGAWVENDRTLPITVLPAFWETPLAYFLYVCFALVLIGLSAYILFTIYRLKHEVSVEQQVSDIKLRFFTNISHELRTPLTLIVGPVEQVLKNDNLPPGTREQLKIVERNTNRMLRMVNQILDFRKIQNKKEKMRVKRVNVVTFIRHIMDSFEALAEQHHIDFLLETEQEALYLWVDPDKLEKIVFNLLSNAFKYTPAGKMINVFIREDERTVSIGVRDQGIGIAESKRKSLFVRFESLADHNLFNQASSGIGLSLVKELVEMHHATIGVESELGEGSTFKVDFLKGREHYGKEVEFIVEDTETDLPVAETGDGTGERTTETVGDDDGDPKELMLIVEDNLELRLFLRQIFAGRYRVIEAVDGEEGQQKALTTLPDMIISDVMMPRKDGLELTRELRTNLTTSHIPIILLTAQTTIESKLEGLEQGADDYITKPFSATYLEARVENLLAGRKKLRDLFRDRLVQVDNSSPAPPREDVPTMTASDRRFMDTLMELIERNMDNGDLMVDDLVQEMLVSRSVFFKKLKTLTGLAPIEFIRSMRIKRAAELIESGEFNMTQIAYMVGFNDPRYFSKSFKAHVGVTPTEYKTQNDGINKYSQGRA
ncbi:MAG: response regulator [Mediterranea sp.]|jgi:signal transduction histidine kinase/DNA-binding response OmpR family regulator/ligand-binding sensor domain-containing protein|nr:response regulator [Mediterranea sp.]